MKRIFITNLGFLLFLNLLIKPFWVFGIDRTVQNGVGSENYGIYFSLLNFSLIFNIILDLGINNYSNRSIARNKLILNDLITRILPVKFFLGIAYALFCFAGGLILGYSGYQISLLALLVVNNILLSMILYLRSNISGLHLFRVDSVISVLDRFLTIIICGVMLWGSILPSPFRIEWFILAQTVSYLITLSIALIFVLRHSGRIVPVFSLNRMKELFKETFPFAVLILLMSLFNRADSVMLERLLPDGKEQAGIYAQSFRILDAAGMFAFLFAGLLLPIFSKMIKNNDHVGTLLGLAVSLLFIPAVILVNTSLFYSHEIIGLLYHEHIDISSETYPKLIFSYLFISLTYIFGSLLTANGNLKQLNILAGITVLLNVSLNLFFIPAFKTIGAAYANVISQAFFASGQIILSINLLKLKPGTVLISKYMIYAACLAASGYLFRFLALPWLAGFSLMVILGTVIPWIFKIITPSGILNVLRYGET